MTVGGRLNGSPAGRDGNVRGALRLFGYDMRRCLATRENVSVHVAFSAERAKEVVLKVLHRGRGSLARDENFARFVDEFKTLYDIDDHAVAEIYDFRVTSQYCYIAMEYFPLGHLGGKLAQPLPSAEALRYTGEIAHALAIIHGAGVVHRDLKPGNIMLRDNGRVALIDFGIAHALRAEPGVSPAAISGTPYYMSPEQARGEPTDERADLYALGVILYQMLTGEKPYVGETTQAILDQHSHAPLPRLAAPLDTHQLLLDRLLAKDAASRLATARELIEAIERIRSLADSERAEPEQRQALTG
jgi:serine/threonine protein kinase